MSKLEGKAAKKPPKPSLGERLVSRLAKYAEDLKAGEPIGERFTARHVKFDFTPKAYSPTDVKAIREKTGASQSVFAKFLGVSVQAIRHWEQGTRQVPPMAARFLEEVDADPGIWSRRLKATESPPAVDGIPDVAVQPRPRRPKAVKQDA